MEFVWLKRIEFYPPAPDTWPDGWASYFAEKKRICIATKSRNMGDALVLTSLPRRLSEKYPGLEISTYPRAFNPVAFRGNPHVSGVDYLPDAVFGDDSNAGSGHQIQLKERFFGLEPSSDPRPEIHLSDSEKNWARTYIEKNLYSEGNRRKPLCILHPWGFTQRAVAPVEFWDEFVKRWQDRFRFWQVGVDGHGAVQGCEFYLFSKPGFSQARKLFAVMSQAQAFVGVDSAPMHVARAFSLPSLIFTRLSVEPARIFENRASSPYFAQENWRHAALYRQNTHINLTANTDPTHALAQAEAFMKEHIGA